MGFHSFLYSYPIPDSLVTKRAVETRITRHTRPSVLTLDARDLERQCHVDKLITSHTPQASRGSWGYHPVRRRQRRRASRMGIWQYLHRRGAPQALSGRGHRTGTCRVRPMGTSVSLRDGEMAGWRVKHLVGSRERADLTGADDVLVRKNMELVVPVHLLDVHLVVERHCALVGRRMCAVKLLAADKAWKDSKKWEGTGKKRPVGRLGMSWRRARHRR